MSALQWLSTAALPLFIVLTLAFSFAKKRDPYEAFLEGAKGGAKIVFQTMPYVVAMVFAVKIFQASGLFDWVGRLLGPLLEPLGIPTEVVPIAALRPFSGGGSLGLLAGVLAEYGVDELYRKSCLCVYGQCGNAVLCRLPLYGQRRGEKDALCGACGASFGLFRAYSLLPGLPRFLGKPAFALLKGKDGV